MIYNCDMKVKTLQQKALMKAGKALSRVLWRTRRDTLTSFSLPPKAGQQKAKIMAGSIVIYKGCDALLRAGISNAVRWAAATAALNLVLRGGEVSVCVSAGIDLSRIIT